VKETVTVTLARRAGAVSRAPAADGGRGPARPATRPAPKEFATDANVTSSSTDKYNIKPSTPWLDANAAWLKSNPGQLVLIEGHADERGTVEYNLALGERRAKAGMNYLVAQGVQANRFTVISYGKERPFCTEHNEACWSQNRRDHFLVKASRSLAARGRPPRRSALSRRLRGHGRELGHLRGASTGPDRYEPPSADGSADAEPGSERGRDGRSDA
jgi:peptidoglycan-associated lipoprotein